MAEQDKEYYPKAINYRRSVNSPLWHIFAYLCVKEQMTPNQLIDFLIQRFYIERKKNNG